MTFTATGTTLTPEESAAYGNNHDVESTKRRQTFQSLVSFFTVSFLPSASYAATPIDVGEAIRRSAANIPGYGPTDVFFPSNLKGSWKATRQVELPGRSEPITLTYPFRFVQSIEDNAVVSDRGTNQAELEKALVDTTTGNLASVRSFEWIMTNPNDLRLVLADGSKKEIKVTKRTTENTDTTITSSEFQRITLEENNDRGFGVPSISARRVLTKWKILDETHIEALEVVYNVPTGGDPLARGSSSAQPSVLSKSRIQLVR